MIGNCYCNSGKKFSACCEPIFLNNKLRVSAEICMRSRYSAFCIKSIDYIIESTFSSQRRFYTKNSLELWADSVSWIKLEIISSNVNTVEFKAYFTEENTQIQIHHEKSLFKQEKGVWYFYEGEVYQ